MPEMDEINLDRRIDSAPDLGQLTSTLGFLLRIAQIDAFEMFYDWLRQTEVKPSEFSVLYVLHRNPGIRQGVVGATLRIKRAHMTKLIRSLEGRGLVTRHIPDDDRRAVELNLTAEGHAFVTRYSGAALEQADREANRLAPAESAELIRLLRKFTGTEGAP